MNTKPTPPLSASCAAIVAQVNTYEQYGPDGFESVTLTLIVTPDTTVGDILKWWRAELRIKPDTRFSGPIHLMAAEVSQNDWS